MQIDVCENLTTLTSNYLCENVTNH